MSGKCPHPSFDCDCLCRTCGEPVEEERCREFWDAEEAAWQEIKDREVNSPAGEVIPMEGSDRETLQAAAEALKRLADREAARGYKRSPVTARKAAAMIEKLSKWA